MIARFLDARRVDVHGGDLASFADDRREDGRVVSGARPDLKYAMTGCELAHLDHRSHDTDLARRADKASARIVLGRDHVAAVDLLDRDAGQERLARDLVECALDHHVVEDASVAQRAHHPRAKLARVAARAGHSHSIVAGGFELTS